MITLKTKCYSDKELLVLKQMLVNANESLIGKCVLGYVRGTTCKDCDSKHVCYDLVHTIEHLKKVIEERGIE